jgi:tetrapyrrole methylase family protein/MazG family protein
MKEFSKLLETIRVLRSPKGCPWDRAQSIQDMKKYLLEETYELLDEIDREDSRAVREELGDLFLILMVITEMFREKGAFSLEDVLEGINTKLVSRHPHVFGHKKLSTKEAVLQHWIKDKAKKKKRKSIKERLPVGAPALLLASIFFRERAHAGASPSGKRDFSRKVARLRKRLSLIEKNPDTSGVFEDILMDICGLAAMHHIDLEVSLRKAIMRKARKSSYGPGGK